MNVYKFTKTIMMVGMLVWTGAATAQDNAPAPTIAPTIQVQTMEQALRVLLETNQKTLENQKKVLERLEKMEETSRQLRIFSKRT